MTMFTVNRSIQSLCAAMLLAACGVAHAGESSCAVAGRVPASLQVATGSVEEVLPTLTILTWAGGDNLKIAEVLKVTGDCRRSLAGFTGTALRMQGDFSVPVSATGEMAPAASVAPLRTVPRIPDVVHDDHSHIAVDFGEFVSGTPLSANPAPRATEFFLGVWRPAQRFAGGGQGIPASTVGVYARTSDGIFSSATPLIRSSMPLRAISYVPAPDGQGGIVGLVQDAPGETRLIAVRWAHREFGR